MPRKDLAEIDPINTERREKVKEAMLHAWNSYVKYAWGMDELQVCFSNSVLRFVFSFFNLSRQTLKIFLFLHLDSRNQRMVLIALVVLGQPLSTRLIHCI
jgi:hypothetical protein